MTRTAMTAGALVLAACSFDSLRGQTPQHNQSEQAQTVATTATPLAFDVVSVKPAAPGTFPIVPAFMRDKGARILGLQRLAAPVALLMAYAYHMQMSELSFTLKKQPDWVQNRVYTVTFRAESEPTRDQVREMMRTMLAERFGLQIHEFSREGAINKLVMSKPGVVGTGVTPHPKGASCLTQEAASVGKAPDASTPPPTNCGFTWYNLPGGVLHVSLTDTTIGDAARSLAGISASELGTRPLVDATGETGRFDITVEYRPDSGSLFVDPDADDNGVPTLVRALKEQLGIKVESGTGPVRMVSIDHISEPTPD